MIFKVFRYISFCVSSRMGGETIKVQNLRVYKVVPEKNLLVVKGCVPGHNNSYVTIQK